MAKEEANQRGKIDEHKFYKGHLQEHWGSLRETTSKNFARPNLRPERGDGGGTIGGGKGRRNATGPGLHSRAKMKK